MAPANQVARPFREPLHIGCLRLDVCRIDVDLHVKRSGDAGALSLAGSSPRRGNRG